MCTDVDRNDKSRICEPGSVKVIGRRQIELYSRLIHTVDHVEGTLRPLTNDERQWVALIRTRAAEWPSAVPLLAAPYQPVRPPSHVAIVLGKSAMFGQLRKPHNVPLTLLGTRTAVEKHSREFMACMLVLEAGMLIAFVALDQPAHARRPLQRRSRPSPRQRAR